MLIRRFAGLALLAGLWDAPAAAQTIEGTVRDLAGRPLEGAEVRAGDQSATTGSDGTFRLGGLSAGAYVLTTRRLGYRPSRVEVRLSAETPLLVEIRLSPAPPVQLAPVIVEARRTGLHGVVAGSALGPLAGVAVKVFGKRGSERRTDASGRFAFPEVHGGDFFVTVTHPGHRTRRFSISIDRERGREVSIRLVPAERVRGMGNAERWDQYELERRLAWAFDRNVLTREELRRYGTTRLCDIPMLRALAGPDPAVIVDGWRRYPDACAWNADEVELVELSPAPRARRGSRRGSGVLRIWLGA